VEPASRTPGAYLLDFAVQPEAKVYPMVPPGAALGEFIQA